MSATNSKQPPPTPPTPKAPTKPPENSREAIIMQLNEAERILSTALYQSKQKLNLIKKANKRPVFSEDLIRYAHNISSQHSVASPYDWNVGDPRRPYPTDLQMRQSLLSGNAPSASDASPFHFIPTGLPGAGTTKKVNIDEKDVDLMSTDSSSSSSSDSQ
jgi:mediator of RNA polymerase II transcription subunit 4